jgi:hypothetical protein
MTIPANQDQVDKNVHFSTPVTEIEGFGEFPQKCENSKMCLYQVR